MIDQEKGLAFFRRAMFELCLNQARVAEILEMTQPNVSRILSGKRPLRRVHLIALLFECYRALGHTRKLDWYCDLGE